MTIETKELVISEELKRKVEMICRFAYVDYEFINGNIKSIKNTNIAYVKPHILKVKNNDYLIFEEYDEVFINGYKDKIKFKELTDYTQSYKDLENEKRNIQYEVRRLEYKNKELQQENNKLKSLLNIIVQSLKQFFRKLLKLGTENDKDKVVEEITNYHKLDLYTNKDLHDIADNTPREDEINDYLYTKNYEKDDRDFDI